MKEYALTVFAVCLMGGIVAMLSHRAFGSAQKCVIGIIILYTILSPAVEMAKNTDLDSIISAFDSSVDLPNYSYESVTEDAFANGLATAVASEFSLDRSEIRVALTDFDFENMRAEGIRITLSGRSALSDYRAIEGYVNKMDIGECRVEIEIG